MARYAQNTTVTVERSRNEIEKTLARYGASSFMYGWDGQGAMIAFVVQIPDGNSRQVRFHLPLPARDEYRFTHHSRGPRNAAQAEGLWEQACRVSWRALHLVVKAKLEAVESGIATFEQEFLSYIMLPDGQTVGQWFTPHLETAYEQGAMPPSVLPALTAGGGNG